MAPEPLHLVNITKTCPRCNSTDVKFVYYNNNQLTQPRYKCYGKGCGRFFTYGGQCRAPRVVNPPRTRTTSTAVVIAERRSGPARRGRPRRSQPVTAESRARQIQETPATRARTEARTVAAGTMARPTTGALGLPRIPISEQRESSVQSPVVSSVVSSVESPAVRGSVPTARIAGPVPGDVDQRTASRTAATVIAQGGDVKENWMKAILGVSPYGLAPTRDGKRMKVMRIKCDGKESLVRFWAEDNSHDE